MGAATMVWVCPPPSVLRPLSSVLRRARPQFDFTERVTILVTVSNDPPLPVCRLRACARVPRVSRWRAGVVGGDCGQRGYQPSGDSAVVVGLGWRRAGDGAQRGDRR